MNLTQLLSHVGLGDGTGNTSVTRVVVLLTALTILTPHVVVAIQSGTIPTFTPDQLELLGIVLGAKLVQNQQETKTP